MAVQSFIPIQPQLPYTAADVRTIYLQRRIAELDNQIMARKFHAARIEAGRVLLLDVWKSHKDEFKEVTISLPAVEKPQPVTPEPQPGCNPMTFIRPVAFHGWRKLAWYLVGLLDNVCHVGRVGA